MPPSATYCKYFSEAHLSDKIWVLQLTKLTKPVLKIKFHFYCTVTEKNLQVQKLPFQWKVDQLFLTIFFSNNFLKYQKFNTTLFACNYQLIHQYWLLKQKNITIQFCVISKFDILSDRTHIQHKTSAWQQSLNCRYLMSRLLQKQNMVDKTQTTDSYSLDLHVAN